MPHIIISKPKKNQLKTNLLYWADGTADQTISRSSVIVWIHANSHGLASGPVLITNTKEGCHWSDETFMKLKSAVAPSFSQRETQPLLYVSSPRLSQLLSNDRAAESALVAAYLPSCFNRLTDSLTVGEDPHDNPHMQICKLKRYS